MRRPRIKVRIWLLCHGSPSDTRIRYTSWGIPEAWKITLTILSLDGCQLDRILRFGAFFAYRRVTDSGNIPVDFVGIICQCDFEFREECCKNDLCPVDVSYNYQKPSSDQRNITNSSRAVKIWNHCGRSKKWVQIQQVLKQGTGLHAGAPTTVESHPRVYHLAINFH